MAEPPVRPYPHPPPPAALRPWRPRGLEAAAAVIAMVAARLPDATIEHVGSSAVPGCDGKGYLDIVILYRDDAHLEAINETLFALGCGRQRNREPFPETRPMRTGAFDCAGETFLLHLHVVPDTSGELEEFRKFRDRLRADPSLVARYVAAKQAILDKGTHDSVDYAKAKGALIAALGFKGAEGA